MPPFLLLALAVAAASGTPGARIAHGLAVHEPSRTLVLFGGQRPDGTPLGDTWGWDGRSWTLLAETGPPARRWPALAWDPGRQRVVLFGGRDGKGRDGASLADCWEWDGRAWTAVPGGPPGRDHFTMTWDARRGALVLFGGWDGKAVRGDTWTRDAQGRWTLASGAGPAPRAAHGAAWDEGAGRVVLYGGRSLGTFFDDTWLWDGRTWRRPLVDGPGRRSFQGMAWDPATRRVVLVGGREGDLRFADTWAWSDGRWTRLPPEGFAARLVYALGVDPTGALLFHGGGHHDEASGTWVLDDRTWRLQGGAWHATP
jgi:hypothetical protein